MDHAANPNGSSGSALMFLVAGAVIISFSGVLVITSGVSATTSAFYRVAIGGVLLAVYSALRGELLQLSPSGLALGAFAGLVFAADLWLFHASVKAVGPGLGTILPNFQVFILAAVGFAFLGERIRPLYVISVPIAMAGLFLLVGVDWSDKSADYPLGILYGLLTAVAYSVFLLTLRRMQSRSTKVSFFTNLAVVSLATATVLAGVLAVEKGSFAVPNWQAGLSLLALGVFSQAIAWNMIMASLPKVQASLAGAVLLLQPSLAFVWDVLFFHRSTDWANWAGLMIVLAAVYAATHKSSPPSPSRT